uniref:Uncharacterized protein n=1 Tax=Rhizophora mucronata TaxID=61149 RepID=A0A2P2P715_RHIMU
MSWQGLQNIKKMRISKQAFPKVKNSINNKLPTSYG